MVWTRFSRQFPKLYKLNVAFWQKFSASFKNGNHPLKSVYNYAYNKGLSSSSRDRLAVFWKYQAPKIALMPAVVAFTAYHFGYFFLNAIPLVHNWRLVESYGDRACRHEEYLKTNPKYLSALLHGYQTLVPPEEFNGYSEMVVEELD